MLSTNISHLLSKWPQNHTQRHSQGVSAFPLQGREESSWTLERDSVTSGTARESLSTIKTRRKKSTTNYESLFLHPKTQPNKRIEKDPFPSKQTKMVVPDQTMKETYLKWRGIFSLSLFFFWKHCQCYVHISMNSFVIRGEEHSQFHFGFLKICKFMNDAIIFFFSKMMSWFAYSNPEKGALVMDRRGLRKRKCRSRTWNYIP